MVKNWKKRYMEPEKVDEEFITHSSLLTNKRLYLLFLKLDEVRIDAHTNPCVPTVKEYYAVVSGIYNNIFAMLGNDENKFIRSLFVDFNDAFFSLFEPEYRAIRCPTCGGERLLEVDGSYVCLRCGDSHDIAMGQKGPNKFQVIYACLAILDSMQTAIIECLQKRKYFLKLEKPPPTGIRALGIAKWHKKEGEEDEEGD